METRTLWNKPLVQRLRRGRGALARHGDFWYPIRVVHLEGDGQWRVRWWRECAFSIPGLVVDTMSTVPEENIIDCLWNNRLGRRQIRVSDSLQSLQKSHTNIIVLSLENGRTPGILQPLRIFLPIPPPFLIKKQSTRPLCRRWQY
jgi:hypothetical protein